MTAEQAASTVLVASPAGTAVDPGRILADSPRLCVRTVEGDSSERWVELTELTTPECAVVTATRADGLWVDIVETIKSSVPSLPVVLVTAETIPHVTSNAVSTGIDAYVNLEREVPTALVDAVESLVASYRDQQGLPADDGYRLLAREASDPMYVLGSDGTVVQCNRAAATLLGADADGPVGRHVSEFVPAEDRERLKQLLADLDADDRPTGTVDSHIVTATGETRPCELSVAPVGDGDGAYRKSVIVSRDLTERRNERAQLRRDRDRLEEFASIVSHDLRNPLNVAIGRLELLLEENDDEHLDTIEDAHRRIERIIDDTLSMALTGSTEGSRQSVSLPVVAEAAWDLVDTGEATLAVNVDGTVHADPGRLQQLFENLFRNAVDHAGDAPAVRIEPVSSIETATRAAGTGATGFAVADDGQGVPPAEREGVFEYGATGADGGTGFGLAIVKDIVTEHDWQINVMTSGDGGACFEITGPSVDRDPA